MVVILWLRGREISFPRDIFLPQVPMLCLICKAYITRVFLDASGDNYLVAASSLPDHLTRERALRHVTLQFRVPPSTSQFEVFLLPHANTHSTGEQNTAKMGIKQLFSLIKQECPDAYKEGDIKTHFGRKVAIVRPPPPLLAID